MGADEEYAWVERDDLRRDYEPHRARMLGRLAICSAVFGAFSLALAVPALAGLPLAAYVWFAAKADLLQIATGVMDGAGRWPTELAKRDAGYAIIVNPLPLLGWVFFLCWLVR